MKVVKVLSVSEIKAYYENAPLNVPNLWNLSRKHFRIVLPNGRFLKLNRFRNRLNIRVLRRLCVRYSPIHVYFTVLDWLFPERVGKKYKANYAVPMGGEYVFDVDSGNLWVPHEHVKGRVCRGCLLNSKELTIHLCEAIEENYSKIEIVFSGRRGFHIHVLDFDLRDWTRYNERNPIKSHADARFKYSRWLASECHGFNRAHFIVATDPMRVISLPYSLNGEGGYICIPVGDRKRLEKLKIQDLLEKANPFTYINRFSTALGLLQAHPELFDSA